jgi:ABC-type transport system involved in multi-copper enzyme maturation permease subunit
MRNSLNRILTVALNTFKEAVRNRAFIGLMLGALVLILASLIVSELVVFDQRKRVVQDFGLFFISFAGVVISITIGVVLVYKELERKTIYSLLPKPLFRHEFILGRYLGIFVILLTVVSSLSGAWLVVLKLQEVTLQPAFAKGIILILGELSVVAAVALLFSTFSTPVLSGIYTFGIFVLGRQIYFIEELLHARKGIFVSAPQLRPFGKAITAVFPDLSLFDISKEILLEVNISWHYVLSALGYGFCYSVLLIALAAVIFQRRDFV